MSVSPVMVTVVVVMRMTVLPIIIPIMDRRRGRVVPVAGIIDRRRGRYVAIPIIRIGVNTHDHSAKIDTHGNIGPGPCLLRLRRHRNHDEQEYAPDYHCPGFHFFLRSEIV